MSGLVFVDSNVLIYARDPGAPPKQARATQWLAYLWRENLGRTSTQVLSEFYVNVTGKIAMRITKEEAWQEVSTFFAWRPQPVDPTMLARAHEIERRWRISWWDSLIVAAAQMQNCSILLTEDLQDGMVFDGVTVRSPFTFEAREPAASYAAVPVMANRHRPRGRPRKAVMP